jgi:hypothetical protein
MIKRILPLLIILVSSQKAFGQRPQRVNKTLEDKYYGSIVMKSGDLIEGDFTYNPAAFEGLLQFTFNGINYTAGPSKVSSFSFFDEKYDTIRKFLSFPIMNKANGVSVEYFMEILHESAFISLIGRKSADFMVGYNFNNSQWSTRANAVRNYETFLLEMDSGELHEMNKRNVFLLTSDKMYEVKMFVKNNRLKLKTTSDFVKVLEYYSEIK